MATIKQRFVKCWDRFRKIYLQTRNENKRAGIPEGFQRDWSRILNQKTFFTEWDIVFSLAEICKKEFGENWVHINTPIDRMFFANHLGGRRGRKFIDIDIVDTSRYVDGSSLRCIKHDIFVEVKWISLGMKGQDIKRRVLGAMSDYEKLVDQVNSNRCEYGYVCIVDDEQKKSNLSKEIAEWTKSPRVKFLLC